MLDDTTINSHLVADPELRAQWLRKGFVVEFMGRYWLTAKGRWEMERRGRARTEGVRLGLVK